MHTKELYELSGADVIDVRDVIARFAELEDERASTRAKRKWDESEEGEEFAKLKDLLESLEGYGGDEQWRESWYPITLVNESYFTDYCQELVQDIGDLPRDIPGYLVIDWEATAHNIRQDYSSVDFDGSEYWYR